MATLQKMRNLNQNRNAFSHSAAQSEAQSRTWISECLVDLIDVMDDIRGLAGVEIYRYLNQPQGDTIRCELFSGHAMTRTIKTVTLDAAQLTKSYQYFKPDQIIASLAGELFSLRPFVHSKQDASGHVTKLCVFRRTYGNAPERLIEYEIVGEAARFSELREAVQVELNALRGLFGLGPD